MDYHRPTSVDEALALLARLGEDAKVLAGGTALAIMLHHRLVAPEALVSLERTEGLRAVEASPDGGLTLGACVSIAQAAAHPLVREHAPALARAYGVVGNVRVRNQATVGGNLAEADYASDPPAMLAALDARVRIARPNGERTLDMGALLLGAYETALEPGELLTHVEVPAPAPGLRAAYRKFTSRSAEDRACVGVAAAAVLEDGVCSGLRVAVGAACEVPTRVQEAEALAEGQPLTPALARRIGDAYADAVDALDDLRGSAWYRRKVIAVEVRRALEEVAG
jgi:carbon-monoxide dehydrogenase medium subunit